MLGRPDARRQPGTPTPAWRRVTPRPCDCHHPPQRHDRWELPGSGLMRRLVTDYAIRTYGRAHIEKLLAGLPPLPEQAWDVLEDGRTGPS